MLMLHCPPRETLKHCREAAKPRLGRRTEREGKESEEDRKSPEDCGLPVTELGTSRA